MGFLGDKLLLWKLQPRPESQLSCKRGMNTPVKTQFNLNPLSLSHKKHPEKLKIKSGVLALQVIFNSGEASTGTIIGLLLVLLFLFLLP